MNIETNRLNTFANWPASAPVDPIRIAKAGFFYTGEGTEVQCFSCNGKISQWNYGDQVMWRHRNLEPNCAFVVNPQLSGNVPLVLGGGGGECPTNAPTQSQGREMNPHPEDHGATEEDEMYQSDALRLLSFINWDDPSVSRESLVNAGFYHAGEGRLRCAWCGGELAPFRNFGSLGPPLDVHRMYFPRCSHAARLQAEAEERANSFNNMSTPSPISYTPPPQSPPDTTSNQPQSSGAAHNERLLSAGSTWRSLGVVGGGARHPAHAALAARLATFDRWPADRTQTPRALAEAGFFYTGTDDQVRCFYCDGGLGRWEPGDAPWTEHARWFPHCGYVLLLKGQQYVDAARAAAPARAPAPAHAPAPAPAPAGQHTPTPAPLSTRSAVINLNSDPVIHRAEFFFPRRGNSESDYPVRERQLDSCMESPSVLAALGAGLDAARVRRALASRLRNTGAPFSSAEALIDAVLDSQLSEEPWSVLPSSPLPPPAPRAPPFLRHFADANVSDIFTTLTTNRVPPPSQLDSSDSRISPSSSSTSSPTPERNRTPTLSAPDGTTEEVNASEASKSNGSEVPDSSSNERTGTDTVTNIETGETPETPKKELTLEEENRQLKEARLCKVCMDMEVSVVFLPCGHLVSCAGCGAALPACPLCRAPVKALVRAYLA